MSITAPSSLISALKTRETGAGGIDKGIGMYGHEVQFFFFVGFLGLVAEALDAGASTLFLSQ